MNRRGFLGRLGMALAAVAVAPAINLLAEPESICHQGLLWQIQNNGSRMIYNPNITIADFEAVMAAMDNQQYGEQEIWMDARVARNMRLFN